MSSSRGTPRPLVGRFPLICGSERFRTTAQFGASAPSSLGDQPEHGIAHLDGAALLFQIRAGAELEEIGRENRVERGHLLPIELMSGWFGVGLISGPFHAKCVLGGPNSGSTR